ncbi:hypothetical protein ACF1BE_34040 [Streptomyces sp. NPDC014991]|uniref:hypothetical protein n=1 Tax=Streptomyces sp. NPDC014991 TaxID=3364935 RepID=UPI00370314EE
MVLVDTVAPNWARPHLAKHLVVDLDHYETIVESVTSYAAGRHVRGVLSYLPQHLVAVSRIASQLKLPAVGVTSFSVLEDLVALRKRLAQHGVAQPRMSGALDGTSAAAYADKLGYPAVIRSHAGLNATAMFAYDRKQVAAACELLTQNSPTPASSRKKVIVQECLGGPTISAETVVLPDGDIRVVAITRTTFDPVCGQEPVRHSVYAHDALLHNPIIRRIIQRTVRAVEITFGVLHISMSLTSMGPRVTDVQAHLTGDLIPLLVKRATGIDLPCIAAALATGKKPELAPTRQRAAAIHFAYPSVSGRIESLDISPKAACHPLVDRMVPLQRSGSIVRGIPDATSEDRLAYWVALGSDASHCHATLDEMTQYLSADIAVSARQHAA